MSMSITPFLWYDNCADAAIQRYQQVFPDTEIIEENRLPDGSVILATIRLQGQTLIILNGGPDHPHSDAFSLSVGVETQDEVDSISDGLIEGGGEQGPCGWLTDPYGLSWQVVPSLLGRLMGDADAEKSRRVHMAMLKMTRLSLQGLQDAYDNR